MTRTHPAFRGVGMQTMGWSTAKRAGSSGSQGGSFRHGWRSAAWRCIRRKTKIVYCKDGKRKGTYPNIQLDFLGYGFRPGWFDAPETTRCFWGFNPGQRLGAEGMRAAMRELNLRHRTDLPMEESHGRSISLRGWIEYYGRLRARLCTHCSDMSIRCFGLGDAKFRRFKAHKIRASRFLQKLSQEKRVCSYTGGLV